MSCKDVFLFVLMQELGYNVEAFDLTANKEMLGDIPRPLDADPCGKAICAYPLLEEADRVAGGISQPLTAPVNGKAKKVAGGNPPALGGRPFQEDRYLYNLNLFKQSIALPILCGFAPDIKNAEGNPSALGQASIAERYLLYTTIQGVLSKHNYTRTHVLKHLVNRKGGECCGG